jgi:hypothetical protein
MYRCNLKRELRSLTRNKLAQQLESLESGESSLKTKDETPQKGV